MSEQAVPKIFTFPAMSEETRRQEKDEQLSWTFRRLYEAGVIDMSPSTKPPGFYVNWTTVTSLIAVLSLIGGLFYFTWNTSASINFERGKASAEKEQLQRELEVMRRDMRLLEEKLKQREGQ